MHRHAFFAIFVCICPLPGVLATVIDLRPLLSGIRVNSNNLTLMFKNARIDDGKVFFDAVDMVDVDGQQIQQNRIDDASYVTPKEQRKQNSKISYKELETSIDRTIDPCIDFYGYVCNGWKATHVVPRNLSIISHSQILAGKLTSRIQNLLSSKNRSAGRENDLMYTFYEKCIEHIENPDNRGFRMLIDKLKVVRSSNTSHLTDWLITMRPQTVFYEFGVYADEYNSTKNIIHIAPLGPTLKNDAYFNPIYAHEYNGLRRFLFRLLDLLAYDDVNKEIFRGTPDDAFRRVEAFLRIDQTIAKIMQETQNNVVDITVRMSELPNVLRSINWDRYFKSYAPPAVYANLQNAEIRITDTLTVARLENMISTISNQTMQDYLDWRAVMYYGDFMDQKYQDLLGEYEREVSGVKDKDRRLACADSVNSIFGDLVGGIYVQEYFEANTRNELHEMVTRIKAEFVKLLDENTWMDEDTKEKARLKANSIDEFIGYNDNIFNKTLIAERYRNLSFTAADNFFEINDKVAGWAQIRTFELLNKQNSKNNFEFPATETNAFYDPNHNNIAILAGILSSPYFNSSFPRVMNYGSIGVVIGHEITHGFDDYGALFDEKGNKRNWWGEETFANFERRKQCIMQQYDEVFIEDLGVHVDGKRTLGENIADNGGMRLAIRAAQSVSSVDDVAVEGLEEYSPMQLFFVNYAYSWCGNMRREALLSEIATNVHAPDVQRVNVLVSNQPEFAAAFGCPKNSPMNPEHRCTLW